MMTRRDASSDPDDPPVAPTPAPAPVEPTTAPADPPAVGAPSLARPSASPETSPAPPAQSTPSTPAGSSRSRRWRRIGIGAGILLLILLLLPLALRLYFSDARIQGWVEGILRREMRLEASFDTFALDLWAGTLTVEGVEMQDLTRDGETVLRLARGQVRTSPWAVAKSLGGRVAHLQVELDRPELVAVRFQRDGRTWVNVVLITRRIERYLRGIPLPEVDLTTFGLVLRDGAVRFVDETRFLEPSELDGIEWILGRPVVDAPVTLQGAARLCTPATPEGGAITFQGETTWAYDPGRLAPEQFTNTQFDMELKKADLLYLARYLGVGGALSWPGSIGSLGLPGFSGFSGAPSAPDTSAPAADLRWTPGKPLSGQANLSAPTLETINATLRLETPALITLWRGAEKVADIAPTRLRSETTVAITPTALTIPTAEVDLRCWPDAGEATAISGLRLELRGRDLISPAPRYGVALFLGLERLGGSELARVLGLQDAAGGHVELTLDARPVSLAAKDLPKDLQAAARDAAATDGAWLGEWRLTTRDAFVQAEGHRFPLGLEGDGAAAVRVDGTGKPVAIAARCGLRSEAITLETTKPWLIREPLQPARLGVAGALRLRIAGAKLAERLGPLARAFGLPAIPPERVLLEFAATGDEKATQLTLSAASHQAGAPTLWLRGAAAYRPRDPHEAGAASLTFNSRLQTARSDALDLNLGGRLLWSPTRRRLEVTRQTASARLDALLALARRFGPSVGLALPETARLGGGVGQYASGHWERTLDEAGAVIARSGRVKAIFELRQLRADLPAEAAATLPGAPALSLQEAKVKGGFEATYTDGAAGRALALPRLNLESEVLTIKAGAEAFDPTPALDLLRGRAEALLPVIEALPKWNARIRVGAGLLRQGAAWIAPGELPALRGAVRCHMGSAASGDAFHLEEAAVESEALSAVLRCEPVNLRALPWDRAFAWPAFLKAIPAWRVEATWAPSLWELAVRLKLAPEAIPLAGKGRLALAYDPGADRLTLERLTFEDVEGRPAVLDHLVARGTLDACRTALLQPRVALHTLPRHLATPARIDSLVVDPLHGPSALKALGLDPAGRLSLRTLSLRDLRLAPATEPGAVAISGGWTVEGAYRIAAPQANPSIGWAQARGAGSIAADAPLRLTLAEDRVAARGRLTLTNMALRIQPGGPWVYEKPAGTPLELHADGSWQTEADRRELIVAEAGVTGGPVAWAIRGLRLRIQPGSVRGEVAAADLRAPIDASLREVLVDTETDKLRFALELPQVDLARLDPLLVSAARVRLSGLLRSASFAYDGKLSPFLRVAAVDPATIEAAAGRAAGLPEVGGEGGEGGAAGPRGNEADGARAAVDGLDSTLTVGGLQARLTAVDDPERTFDLRLQSLRATPARGTAAIDGLVVGKPTGFYRPDPIQIRRIDIAFDPASLFRGVLTARRVAIEGMDATYEIALGKSNVGRLVEDLEYFQNAAGGGGERDSLVEDFRLTGARVQLSPTLLRGRSMIPPTPLPPIHLTNVRGGSPMAIVASMAKSVLTNIDDVGAGIFKGLSNVIKKPVRALESGVRRINPFRRDGDDAPDNAEPEPAP